MPWRGGRQNVPPTTGSGCFARRRLAEKALVFQHCKPIGIALAGHVGPHADGSSSR
jgi:hypothetical protein